jgi:hypothetical protein
VFVQLALVVDGEVDLHSPVMAFVSPKDSWLMIINEFMMVRAVILYLSIDYLSLTHQKNSLENRAVMMMKSK